MIDTSISLMLLLVTVIEICERLATMGIAVNLVTYLGGTMHLPSAESANIVTDFMGTSFLLCLFGGFLADSFLGRYLTIAIFAMIQALGTCMLSISTKLPQLRPPPCDSTVTVQCQRANGFQMGALYLSLYLIAVGTGGLKSSVSGFGTDQFDEKDEKERSQMAYFFNRFFFFISTGTLLACTVLVYIQDEVGRSWAYGVCCISMVLALLVFLSGTRRYRYKKSSGSPIVHILQVIVAAIRKRKLMLPSSAVFLYDDCPEASRIRHTDQFRFLDKAAIVAEDDHEVKGEIKQPNPWKMCSVTRIEEVKMMIRLLPIWATTFMFWTIYAQMITFSVEQATTMERSIGSFQIPAGSLTAFFVAAILITCAVYDRVIMPLMKKWKGKQALAEVKRLSVAREAPSGTTTLPISVFTLIPQFLFVELLLALLQPVAETRTWRGTPSSPSSKHVNPSPSAFKPTYPAFSSRRKPTLATPTRSPRRQAYLSSPYSPSLPPRRTMEARLFDVKRRFLAEVPALLVLSLGIAKAAGPLTKEELGRATWTLLHAIAAQYPDQPTRQQKHDVKELLAILSRLYPCKECADHFKEVLK
ncbi:hypothetical protein GW17_00007082 [Ensete ventricosum]|nr:hypothetical protein GW17_00007082 [Ensete ventricosum]